MIDHIKIFVGFICLLAGVGAIVYLFQVYHKYKKPVLRTVYQYSIFMLILFIGIVISKYIQLNLSEISDAGEYDIYLNIGTMILIFTQVGMLYSLLCSNLYLNQLAVPRYLNLMVLIILIGVCISYLIRIILSEFNIFLYQLNRIHSLLWNNLVLLEIPVLLFFLFFQNKKISVENRRMNILFAALFFSRLPVAYILLIITDTIENEILKLIFPIGFFLYYIAIPIVWVRYYYQPFLNNLLNRVEKISNLELIFTDYDISKREQEILKLLVEGKSNRDIAELLFIAIPTVKNHVYSIYRKLDVKSRYQLIHFITTQ